jgi:hypothetical protein
MGGRTVDRSSLGICKLYSSSINRFTALIFKVKKWANQSQIAVLFKLSVADVSKTFKQVNVHNAAEPDGLPGPVLRACADQLARVRLTFSTSP